MPVKLHIKGTDKYVHVNSGKWMWNAAGHAKAALRTSGISYTSFRELATLFPQHPVFSKHHGYRCRVKFEDVEDVIEIEEYNLEKPGAVKEAVAIIAEAIDDIADYCCNPELVERMEAYLKEHK